MGDGTVGEAGDVGFGDDAAGGGEAGEKGEEGEEPEAFDYGFGGFFVEGFWFEGSLGQRSVVVLAREAVGCLDMTQSTLVRGDCRRECRVTIDSTH